MKYVSLHHHSTHSYMDGFGTPAQHVARAVDLDMAALALTEHGNCSSHVALEQSAVDAGIKPIFGLEAYCAPVSMREDKNTRKWHLTILAATDVGYRNLMRLITRSWAEGFYQWPTISGPMLAEHNEGLIVLSGCADSKLACDLLGGKGRDKGDVRDAVDTAERFRELFGDRYYLEVQQFPELERACAINGAYASIGQSLGIPLVATSDVHYPLPDDNEMQKILHAAGRGTGTVAAAEASWEYSIRLTLPESDAQILTRLARTGLTSRQAEAAVATSAEIAERCNVTLPKVDRLRFPTPTGTTSAQLVWDWLREGWEYRWGRNANMRRHERRYVDRLKYEMELIESKDFIDYFLMLSDAVRWCKDRGIPVGPARGSAAASLACYLLRITEVDPLQYPLMLFERFIDVNRTDLPDVDLDFDDERREELRQHMVEMYGDDHVGNLGTFTRYRGRNALVDVARVYGIPEWEVKTVKDLMLDRSGGDSRFDASIEDTVAMFPQAAEVFKRFPRLSMALKLEGNLRSWSTHAAGLVVSNSPLTDNVASYQRTTGTGRKRRTRQVLSVDKYDAEYLGLLKADFLGLTTMGMLRHALNMIDMKLDDMYTIPLDDPEVLSAFNRSDVVGVFQFGGGATRIVNHDVQPDSFTELIDINALSRPGPLHSGATQDYIDVKHGRKKPESLHPIVDRLTADTKGQIIYQEQILAILRELGGLPWTKIQAVRKIISLKKGEGAFVEHGLRDFLDGCEKLHGVHEDQAMRIWRKLVTSGQYAFNVAHCVSYSTIAYWTMWLKVHHPLEFYAAALRKYPDAEYALMRDAMKHGIEMRPPDINRSGETWQLGLNGQHVLAGLSQIPSIGESIAGTIIEDRRDNGRFNSWNDVMRVVGIGPSKMESIRSMVFDSDPFRIHHVDNALAKVRRELAKGLLRDRTGRQLPTPTHTGATMPTGNADIKVVYLGMPTQRDLRDLLEDERARTGEDIEVIRARIKDSHLVKKMYVRATDDSDQLVFLRWGRYVFPRFEKALMNMRLDQDLILVKGTKRSGFGTSVYVDNMWVIDPT
jgi:Zierdtviridae DNA polymerase